jgi:M6 family metalloprotease-like protein
MKVLLSALLLIQDPPLAAEKERIRQKPALTPEEKSSYSFPALSPVKPRSSYSLAVVPVAFSDAKTGAADLAGLFFGKVAEYYARVSGGNFELRGKTYAPVTLGIARASLEEKDFEEAMARFRAREGQGVLAAYDGAAFVLAGGLGQRGTPLWPHKQSLRAGERTLDYIVTMEGVGDHAVGVAAHEIMHLLGFYDKYDDAKASVGKWCILGTGYSEKNPAPPCADCREKLGWTALGTADLSGASSVVLAADLTRALKVPVNPDGSEYLLCEMRDRLFIWHVGGGKTIELLGRFPSEAGDRLTPLSDPPFRGRTVGARPVWITDIRLGDGKAWFKIAPDAPLTPLEDWRKAHVGKLLGD